MNQLANEGDLKITKGSVNTYTYKGDSGRLGRFIYSPYFPSSYSVLRPLTPFFFTGNPVHCYYCPNCTAHPYHHQTALGPKIVVRTSLLEGSKNFPVAVEIFGKDRLSWQHKIAEKVFEGPPE